MSRLFPLLLLLPALSGAAQAPPQAVAGHFTVEWEVMAFRPCGSAETWWVADAGELGARYREVLGGGEYGTVFARLRGEVSGRGRFGHMGRYDRLLTVTELLEVREKGESDCRSHPPDAE